MLAGATGIDFVLLVVAADDGVMPQTLEHLAIVDLLGIARGMVALTKVDLVAPDGAPRSTAEIARRLKRRGLAARRNRPGFHVTGEGIEALRENFSTRRRAVRARCRDGRFRLAVDRCFTLTGVGTVVTGTVLSGRVAVGDQVVDQPVRAATPVCVRIHAQNRPAERGQAGERCALNLAGDGISQGCDRARRCGARSGAARADRPHRCDLRVLAERDEAGRPLDAGSALSCRGRSRRTRRAAEERPIAPGAQALVQLVLERPIAAAVGDRFMLRDTSAQRTHRRRTFLDLRAPQRKRRRPERLAATRALAIADPDIALAALLGVAARHSST